MHMQEVEDHDQLPASPAMVDNIPVLPHQVINHPPPQVEPLISAVEEPLLSMIPATVTLDGHVTADRGYTSSFIALVEVAVVEATPLTPDNEDQRENF